jgi:hypothetical protein
MIEFQSEFIAFFFSTAHLFQSTHHISPSPPPNLSQNNHEEGKRDVMGLLE